MKSIKISSLAPAALISLSLHGLLAALFIPSFVKVAPKAPMSFEVAWVSSLHCHPSCKSEPEEKPLGKNNSLKKTIKRVDTLQKKHASTRLPPRHPPAAIPCVAKNSRQGLRDEGGAENKGKGHTKKNVPDHYSLHTQGSSSLLSATYHPLPSYPWVCRKRGQEGMVCIQIKTNEDGHVVEARLHKSSGHDLLDKAALNAVKRWALNERDIKKIISIIFRLKENNVSFS